MAGTRDIARFVIETPSDAVPAPTLEAVNRSCFDALGVLLAGSTQPVGQIVERYALARGGTAESTLLPSGARISAPEAAFANATMAHALDYDDMGGYGHPTAPLLPALLALGEKTGATGMDLLTSYAVGFEVGYALCKGGNYDQYEKGFHSTPVFGTVAAAAACARLLGLTVDQAANALGIAASEASGVGRNNGSMTKPLHAGMAARNGVVAALLAQDGLTAIPDVYEAPQGFAETFLGSGRYDLERVVEMMGNPFHAQDQLVIKKYPCCGGSHSALDALFAIMREHALRYDDVEAIEVRAMRYTSPVLRYPEPPTGLTGKFSVYHTLGAAIREGEVRIDAFTDQRVNDPALVEARGKVHAEVLSRWDPRARSHGDHSTPVTVRLKDGRAFTKGVGFQEIHGAPADPLSRDELVAKFRANVGLALRGAAAVERARHTWERIDEIKDFGAAVPTVCRT
jgi:2-methylcitrate dehydratase PrpD